MNAPENPADHRLRTYLFGYDDGEVVFDSYCEDCDWFAGDLPYRRLAKRLHREAWYKHCKENDLPYVLTGQM